MNKEYNPLIIGVALYLVGILVNYILPEDLDWVGILIDLSFVLIFPGIIGFLTGNYVRAIIYAVISVTIMTVINAVITSDFEFAISGLLLGYVLVAVFSVVGVFIGLRFATKLPSPSQ